MKYYLSAILGMLMWSSSFIATKIAYRAVSPILLCVIRFAIASVIMMIMRLMQKKRTRIPLRDQRNIILSAAAGISVYYVLENIALQYTTASAASFIEAAYPIITVLIGVWIYHEKTSKRMLAGIFISIIGVLILSGFSTSEGSGLKGDILLLIDGALWGFYNFLVQRIPKEYDNFSVSYYQMLWGTVMFLPMLFLEKPVFTNITSETIIAILYLSTGCSVAAFLLYNYGLSGISASSASAIMNLMPLFGVLLSFLILHETISLSQIAGGILIMLGVYISTNRHAV
jgi:drug/metabolite transporter (DMT)-like permease